MERPDLKEYDVLSEDRRRAVENYIKGVIMVAAVYAFGVKLIIDSTNLLTMIIIGAIGLIMIPFQIAYWSKCKKHDQNINLRLNEIGEKYSFSPVICTQYVFHAGLLAGIVLYSAWIGLLIVRFIELY